VYPEWLVSRKFEPMSQALTAAAVAKLRPGPIRRIIRDSQSLYLVIQPSGHKSRMMRFRRPGGKPGKLVLGPVDTGKETTGEPVIGAPLTLKAARQLAAQVLRERALGRDPVADHKAARQRRHAKEASMAAGTYAVMVRRYAEERAKPRMRKWRYTMKQLGLAYPKKGGEPIVTKGGLAQRWADRAVQDIDDHDIWTVVDEARRIGCPGIVPRQPNMSEARGRDLHSALSSLFGWLKKDRRLIKVNPAADIARTTPEARDRVLTNEEIIRFWNACDKISVPFGAVFKLLLLTGCRLNEIGAMRYDEIKGDSLELPSTRTKNKKAHIVPLAPLARRIIEALPHIENCSYVFSTTGRTPVSGWHKAKQQLDKEMAAASPWRLHDLRRTAVTGMNELGIMPHVVEMIVNHISGYRRGVAGVYNRSLLLPERRAALERWAHQPVMRWQHCSECLRQEPRGPRLKLRYDPAESRFG
jgi:integrase